MNFQGFFFMLKIDTSAFSALFWTYTMCYAKWCTLCRVLTILSSGKVSLLQA